MSTPIGCQAHMVSVVIPMFNGAQYIERTIASVLQQTHKEYEIIVVDDGSTDKGGDCVAAIGDHRIRLIRQSNCGVSVARNTGVAHSRSEWVAFLDSDDEYLPTFLEKALGETERWRDHHVTMVGANYVLESRGLPAIRTGGHAGIQPYFDLFRCGISPNNSSSTLVLKSAFLKTGGFPIGIRSMEDWIVWAKLAFSGAFVFMPEPLSVYHNTHGACVHGTKKLMHIYEGAMAFAETIAELTRDGSGCHASCLAALECRSEVCIHVAMILARSGLKRPAVRLLRSIRWGDILRRRQWQVFRLAIILLVPDLGRRLYQSCKCRISAGKKGPLGNHHARA